MPEETRPLTPRKFWETAAQWGSAVTGGDPGACMYGFDERGVVQSEQHRQDCIAWLESHCRKIAAASDEPEAQAKEIDALIAYLKSAPADGQVPELDAFTRAYVTAALWSSNDEADETGGEPLDRNYSEAHVAPEALERMRRDCAAFKERFGHLFTEENLERGGDPEEQAGHDFWLTRNRHGAGFWDGDWNKPAAEDLDQGAKAFGECYLYVGDDGLIHQDGGVEAAPASLAP